MRTPTPTLALLSGLLALTFPGGLFAAPEAPEKTPPAKPGEPTRPAPTPLTPSQGRGMVGDPTWMFTQLDTDHDGKLTRDEFARITTLLRESALAAAPANPTNPPLDNAPMPKPGAAPTTVPGTNPETGTGPSGPPSTTSPSKPAPIAPR